MPTCPCCSVLCSPHSLSLIPHTLCSVPPNDSRPTHQKKNFLGPSVPAISSWTASPPGCSLQPFLTTTCIANLPTPLFSLSSPPVLHSHCYCCLKLLLFVLFIIMLTNTQHEIFHLLVECFQEVASGALGGLVTRGNSQLACSVLRLSSAKLGATGVTWGHVLDF